MLGYVYALKGERDLALNYLESLSRFHDNHAFPMTYRARIWFALGDVDRGFGYLEDAAVKRESELVGAWIDPRWKPVKNSSRFECILFRAGLGDCKRTQYEKQPLRSLEEAA